MKARTVVSFPWPIGAAHADACIIVPGIPRNAGYDCVFAGVLMPEHTFVNCPLPPVTYYLAIPGPDAGYSSLGYYHPERIELQRALESALIRRKRRN